MEKYTGNKTGILEKSLFFMGVAGIIAVAGAAAFMRFSGAHLTGILPPCSFYTLFGRPCPGCGGTRAVEYLLEGKILQSFLAHPLILYAAAAYLYFMVYYGYMVFLKKRAFSVSRLPFGEAILIGAGALLLIQWVVKLAAG